MIRCYAEGKFTFVQEGRPVWPEYDDELMSGDTEVDPYFPVQIGVDFGLTPAAIFGQRTNAGGWRILDELVTFDMGLERFGQELLGRIAERYSKSEILIWGDPAGNKRDEIYEVTAFDHLRSLGFKGAANRKQCLPGAARSRGRAYVQTDCRQAWPDGE